MHTKNLFSFKNFLKIPQAKESGKVVNTDLESQLLEPSKQPKCNGQQRPVGCSGHSLLSIADFIKAVAMVTAQSLLYNVGREH